MSDRTERSGSAIVREIGGAASFVLPALALELFGVGIGPGLWVPIVAGAIVVGLGRFDGDAYRGAEVPIVLLGVAIPALGAPSTPGTAALGAAAGLGVLAWLSLRSGVPSRRGSRIVALSAPAFAASATFAVAVATPGLSGGPGLAALILIAALLLVAGALAGRTGPPSPQVMEGQATPSS